MVGQVAQLPDYTAFWFVLAVVLIVVITLSFLIEPSDGRSSGCASEPCKIAYWHRRHVPLLVLTTADLADHWHDVVRQACVRWNTAAGFPLLLFGGIEPHRLPLTTQLGMPGIVFVDRIGDEAQPQTHLRISNYQITCAHVLLPDHIAPSIAVRTALHELGHALGLAHDIGFQDAAMFPVAKGGPTTITDRDLRKLRRWYGHLQ